jgi:hypothetical protein
MRVCALILALALTAGYNACGRAKPVGVAAPALSGLSAPEFAKPIPSTTPTARVDFNTQVRPLLESRCTPCHFAGGTMYERLPFDRPETIKTLGEKLFTRIKDEKEQRLIREFLKQQAEESHASP